MYTKEELLWKQVLWVINFPKKQIANFISECLITGFVQNNWDVVIAIPDKKVPNGMKLFYKNCHLFKKISRKYKYYYISLWWKKQFSNNYSFMKYFFL